ncbi:MAG: hypothetical protein AUK44_03110 [Porphyromonadaceae bacterium CG2_30_38_12]|nr:MAG: hypothetical protein AUK44_03110 [Porphyromonadaceae bacterium CG2_30_38_12]
MNTHRPLTDKEIATLTVYGCSASNWKDVSVANDFKPDFITNVHFSGTVRLGTFQHVFELAGGIQKHAGIYNAVIHNCHIGHDVFIDKINGYIANYQINDKAYLENIDELFVVGKPTFGNGVRVATMIESGAREVSIYQNLSAPLAYMLAFYRHNKALIETLECLIADYSKANCAEYGTIGKSVQMRHCGSIRNVNIGDFAILEGVSKLSNGTIVSSEMAVTTIGTDVQCNEFIIQSGSTVIEASMLTRCFVGQGCLIGKQFSAIDSLLFANFQGMHGEAVSIFAGPYTVTHHKATLMLTALYSFMNAGSGTNFSNHMYKLGPVHQGITERGVKTSSDAYIMWPARIGAFTVVLGRHKGNPNISALPFSYLMEIDGESHLVPGINLHSAGTMRDVEKWTQRDERKGCYLDPICFDFLSPYTISKALQGIEILKDLLAKMDNVATFVWYENCKIKRSAIRKGIELYEFAVALFMAQTVKQLNIYNVILAVETSYKYWVDMVGLVAPKSQIELLIAQIISEKIGLDNIQERFNSIHENYKTYSQIYAVQYLEAKFNKTTSKFSAEDVEQISANGQRAEKALQEMILRDARKEFNAIAKIGFGIDGDTSDSDADFEATRGHYENHPFVNKLLNKK